MFTSQPDEIHNTLTLKGNLGEISSDKELLYQVIFETSEDGVLITAPDGRIFDANPAALRILGYSKEEFLQKARKGIADKNDPRFKGILERRARDGYASGEANLIHKNGSLIPVELFTKIFSIGNGELNCSVIFRDISEKKKAEEALRASEALYRGVVSSMAEGVLIHSVDDSIIGANASAEKILEFTKEELLGNILFDTKWDFIHEDGTPFPRESLPDLVTLHTGKPCAAVILGLKRRDKTVKWVSINSQPVFDGHKLSSVLVTFVDVTEQKIAEETLKRSEKIYRTLAKHLPDSSILIFDKNLCFLLAEGNTITKNGFSTENIESKTLQEVLPDKSVERLLPFYEATLAGFEKTFESYYEEKDRTFLNRTIPIFNDQNQVIAGMIFSRDITEEKQSRRLLEKENDQLTVTLWSIGEGVITINRDAKITLVNRAAETLTGWDQTMAKDKPLAEVFKLLDRTTREEQTNLLEKTFITGEITTLKENIMLVSRDGREIPISGGCAPIRDYENNISGAVMVFQDITEREKIIEERFKNSKLESLGVLAGGIAHDFNNLLTGIIGFLSLIRFNLKEGKPIDRVELKEMVEEVENASIRAKDLTQQLLTFAKGGSPVKKAANLLNLIREEADFVIHGSPVQVLFDFSSEVNLVEVDSGQLGQVIHNLVLNGCQAMPQGGHIKIKVDNINLVEEEIPPLPEGKYVRVSIQDEGIGIDSQHLTKIFDPYFTTKAEGSGIGLAVTYSIIKNHNGYITVESEIDRGTNFTIYIPSSDFGVGDKEATAAINVGGKVKPVSPKRILVMDDNEILIKLLVRIFKKVGNATEVAKDGREAIRLYREAKEAGKPFDLVILDLTIPGGLGGKETMERLLEIDPSVTAVVSSGYSKDPIMANYRNYGFKWLLTKPYQIEEIYSMLEEVFSNNYT